MLEKTFEVSQRRACQVIGQPRSTQRLPQPSPDEVELALRCRLRAISKKFPRWGYRKATTLVNKEGYEVNKKRVQRLWREEGLRVPKKTKKRRRGRCSEPNGSRRRAVRPNEVWAIDFQFDTTVEGRQLKLCNIVDEFTREALAMRVGRSCDADTLVSLLDRLAHERGAPALLRMDNGPELTAAALRDWARFNKAGTIYIEPGSPWENPFAESFNSRVRDELLNVEVFYTLTEAKVMVEDWRIEYNEDRPHSSLGMLAPNEFTKEWIADHQPNPALS